MGWIAGWTVQGEKGSWFVNFIRMADEDGLG